MMKPGKWVTGLLALLLLQLVLAQPNILQGVVAESDSPTPQVSTEELKQLIAEGSTLILDSRSFPEWAVGHIPGAIVLAPKPGQSASQYVSDIAEVERLTNGDKDAAIILYCNGPVCGKSKRLSGELAAAGYSNVRRYQLGAPVWRALGNPMVIEPAGVQYVLNDRTAYWVDARAAAEIMVMGGLSGVRNLAYVTAGTVNAAKDEKRVPMHDYNARIVVFGAYGEQAKQVAEELAQGAFHNVAYFKGSFEAFQAAVTQPPAQEASQTEANKAFIRRYLEAISGQPKTEAMLREFITSEALIEHVRVFEAAFPRYELEGEDMMAEGDKVVIRALLRGVHGGELFGIPATGKQVEAPGIIIFRIENGKVADFWIQADVMSLMQQLRVEPEATR